MGKIWVKKRINIYRSQVNGVGLACTKKKKTCYVVLSNEIEQAMKIYEIHTVYEWGDVKWHRKLRGSTVKR